MTCLGSGDVQQETSSNDSINTSSHSEPPTIVEGKKGMILFHFNCKYEKQDHKRYKMVPAIGLQSPLYSDDFFTPHLSLLCHTKLKF